MTTTDAPSAAHATPPPVGPRFLGGAPVRMPVFVASLAGVLAMAAWALISPTSAESGLGTVTGWVTEWFGWFYVLLATAVARVRDRPGPVAVRPRPARPRPLPARVLDASRGPRCSSRPASAPT